MRRATMVRKMTVRGAIALLALCPLVACSEAARPATQTLQTGVDQAALRADIGPHVADWPNSPTPTETVTVGRPYGLFTVEKGPRLVFTDAWEVPILGGTEYQVTAAVVRKGDIYEIVSMGSAERAALLGEREKIPSVSSALDQGRAGLLHPVNYSAGELLAYEVDGPAYPGNIRVQPLDVGYSFFAGLDASADGLPDASLAEINGALP
jgi:hypothetical protein